MRQAGIEDPYDIDRVRALGVIDLPTIQKKMNLHYSLSLDLFGSEVSTNAANVFNAGLKGRFHETEIDDDHRLTAATYPVLELRRRRDHARSTSRRSPRSTCACATTTSTTATTASSAGTRSSRGRASSSACELPHVAFHRQIGEFRDVHVTPDGRGLIARPNGRSRKDDWLPSTEDGDFIESLMEPESEPGQFAGWIAPPKVGIDNKPGDFEYVKIAA